MRVRKKDRSFFWTWPLLISQTIGAFNDNVVKAFLPAVIAFQFGKEMIEQLNYVILVLLYCPFVLFAPLAGWISDRFSKKKVVGVALFSQIFGLVVLGFSFRTESLAICLFGFFLLSTQSAFLSPGKKGILKEIVGFARLGKAVGWLEMTTMVGILGGSYAGAVVYARLEEDFTGWESAYFMTLGVSFMALVSWLIFLPTPETKAEKAKPFKAAVLFNHYKDLKFIFSQPGLRWAALGDAWFWSLGGFLWLVLVELAGEVVPGNSGISALYGWWSLMVGFGIMLGCLFSAYLNHGRVEIGLTAIGGLGMPLSILGLYMADPESLYFDCSCNAIGFFGALYFVPLNGQLQNNAENKKRGRVLASSVLLTQASGVLLSLVYGMLTNSPPDWMPEILHLNWIFMNLSAKELLSVVMIPSALIGIFSFLFLFEDFFRALAHVFLRIFYRIRLVGIENFPEKGGVLLVSNHLSYADPVFIGAAFPRKIRYLAHSSLSGSWIMRFLFRVTKTLTISSEKSRESFRKSIKGLRMGTPLCIFAEGEISRLGLILPFMRGVEVLGKQAKVPILPVHLDGVWGSIFSMERGVFFRKLPLQFPYTVTVRAGNLIENGSANAEFIRQEVLELGRQSYAERMKFGNFARKALRRQIRKNKKSIFLFPNGGKASGEDLAESILGDGMHLASNSSETFKNFTGLIRLNEREAEIIYANWVRIREINLWDHNVFFVSTGIGPWMEQWIPWIPMLGGKSVRLQKDGALIAKSPEFLKNKPEVHVSGLATKQNGLVSLNGPDPNRDSRDNEIINQPGMKAGTFGRLLNGFSYRKSNEVFCLSGVREKEELEIVSTVDSDGFLVPS